MTGVNSINGKPLDGAAHLAQSIADILTTPLGSRVMRRDYGSLLFELIDRPVNGGVRMLLQAAAAIALRRWEPRLQLTRVSLSGQAEEGRLSIRIEGYRTDLPSANDLTIFTIPIQTSRATPLTFS